jgi:hypothetical protein
MCTHCERVAQHLSESVIGPPKTLRSMGRARRAVTTSSHIFVRSATYRRMRLKRIVSDLSMGFRCAKSGKAHEIDRKEEISRALRFGSCAKRMNHSVRTHHAIAKAATNTSNTIPKFHPELNHIEFFFFGARQNAIQGETTTTPLKASAGLSQRHWIALKPPRFWGTIIRACTRWRSTESEFFYGSKE